MASTRSILRAVRSVRSPAMASRTQVSMWAQRSRTAVRSFSAASNLQEKYYTQSHEWIELDSDKKTGSIGISAHAANALGDIVFVELPEVDTELNSGDAMGAVESVKSASDLYVPVSGTISEINSKLEEKPSLINQSPETEGWIAKITLAEGEADRVSELMNAEDYKKFSE